MEPPANPQGADPPDKLYRAVIDAFPCFVLVVDSDVRVVDCNVAARDLLGQAPPLVLRRRAGDAFHCIHSTETPGGCGTAPACQDCVLRNSVTQAANGVPVSRRTHRMELVRGGVVQTVWVLVTASPLEYGREHLVLLVLQDVSELIALQHIIPICAHCRKVRDDGNFWRDVESYFKTHMDISFSHGICPECAARFFGEFIPRQS